MIFSSLEFLYLYIPVCLFIYFIIPASKLWVRNLALLFVSLIFYGWAEPLYIFIMLFSIAVDYICGYIVAINRESNPKKAKAAMISSVIINLSVLFFFKYFDFVIESLALIPAFSHLKPLGIALPVGISFYTFQTMSYTLDIYMGKAKLQKNIFSFGSYVAMFPQLIAGPIVRYSDVDEALRVRTHSFDNAAKGITRFICGLAKKVLLANAAGVFYEQFSANVYSSHNLLSAWLGLVFFGFQIYFDFSGYSDMAIGLGYILGFRFPENFDHPYTSKSVSEFWRRWHITLSVWFKEYVYFPLGGNKKGKGRTFFNLLVVWFLTGFWHGAEWIFIIWGLYFGALIIIEKAFLGKWLNKIPQIFSRLYTLFTVIFSWFIFISCDMPDATTYFSSLFTAPLVSGTALYDFLRSSFSLVIFIIASTNIPLNFYNKFKDRPWFRGIMCVALPLVLIICTAYLVDSSYNPFLYFRF